VARTTTLHQALEPAKLDLFLVSAVSLFLELALIRWLPAHILFLTFFTNTVLLASFLGLAVGCMATRHTRTYISATSVCLLILLVAGLGMEWIRLSLQDIIDVGGNKSVPQMVYFGTEVRVTDLAAFVIPIEFVVGAVFLGVAATMAGLGQALGRRFGRLPNGIEAYTINIGGSLCGVLLFQFFSMWFSPVWWFGLIAVGLTYFVLRDAPGKWWAVALAVAAPLVLLLPEYFAMGVVAEKFPVETWSPYYRINYSTSRREIVVNLLGHQNMVSRNDAFPAYAIPYLLNRDAAQTPFRDILIIGAGSGNDVSRALQWAAADARIDAVEIDPVILSLGKRDHPDHPYQDPRVTVHLGDGRNFLRSTTRQYDLIVFALIDSLVLHSSVSSLRLESYLFTRQAMADVAERLKPDGMFVTYNYFRQGWIVSRLAKTMLTVFGRPPMVLTLPPRDTIAADQRAEGFTLLFEGKRADAIEAVFGREGRYSIASGVPPSPLSPNGFRKDKSASGGYIDLRPVHVEVPADIRIAEDTWPFLYLRSAAIPAFSWHGIVVMGLISIAMLWFFGWRGAGAQGGQPDLNVAVLLLGAGFMLIETKAVVHMALIFGSTWTVNAVVFFAVLAMIGVANLWVLNRRPAGLRTYYAGLFVMLALNVATPLDSFLGLPQIAQGLAAGVLVLSPVFFAGAIFATLLRDAKRTEQALAYNTAGALIGGFTENVSLLVGFNYIIVVAGIIYCASWIFSERSLARSGGTVPLAQVGAS
jgi:spermidine synthase